MATLTLDTYQFVQTLKQSGIPELEARAIAEGLTKVDLTHMASKEDIALLKAEIQQVRIDLLKWVVPLLIGQVAVFTSIQVGLLAVLAQWLHR